MILRILDAGRTSTFTCLGGVFFSAMGFLSPRFPQFADFRTLYCNPFFRRCKQNFCKFQNFFPGNQNPLENQSPKVPEFKKHRLKPLTEGFFPDQNAGNHPDQIHCPDISPADGEADIDPDPHRPQGKYHICQNAAFPSHRTKKSVENAQAPTQQHTAAQPPDRCGGGHRHSRCQRPPSRGSS